MDLLCSADSLLPATGGNLMLQPTDWSNLLTTGDLQRLTCDPHVSGWHAWLNDTLVDFATRGVVASVQGNYVAVNCAFWKYLTGFHNDKKEDDSRLRKLAAQYGVWDSAFSTSPGIGTGAVRVALLPSAFCHALLVCSSAAPLASSAHFPHCLQIQMMRRRSQSMRCSLHSRAW